MKKILILLLFTFIATAQNPKTVPSPKQNIGVNYNFQNLSLWNGTLENFNFKPHTTVQMNAITTPKIGQIIYNTTTNTNWFYNGSIWVNMQTSGGGGSTPIYSDNIANVTEVGTDGQFLYITNTGDEFGVIDEVYVWIGSIWSPYPPQIASALWVTTNTDPTATSNTGTLPRFEDNTTNTAKWYIDTNGVAKRIEYRKVSGSIMAANACVNTIVHVPNGTPNSTKTVGTGGDFADLATALASATVVNGTILKVLNDLTITATINVNKAVVIDFNGKVISSSTTLPVNMFNITAGATLKNGTMSHLKTANTSVETIVAINSPTAPVYIYNNIFNIQEFAISARGQFYIGKNTFNYVGTSLTNSHRFIILYGNSGESRIYENKYTASAKQGTTRYTNFLLATSTTGTAYSGKLYINNNTQMGGDLRQFFMHEAGIPTSMELYVAHNTFNDFNGGIGFLDPTIYNGYSKIGIYSNTQGGDAVGNYKGVLYVDGTGAINENTILEYADNTQGTTALRADYVSYATDNSTEIAIKNTVTFVAKKTKVTIEEAENNLGILVQQLKNTKTYISGATGVGTESDPYVVTSSSGGTNALWTTATTNPTATGNTGTLPRFVENTVNGSKWYIDSTGSAKIIEANTVSAQVVYINAVSPIGATIFDTENPPVTNNNALKNLDNALYIATNGSTWNSNGTTYSTYTVPSSTPFYLNSTTVDAGSNKTNLINRTGSIVVDNGFLRASSTSLNYTFTIDPTDPLGPKLKLGTPSNIAQYFEIGAYNSVNNFDSKTRTFKIFNSNAPNAFNILNTNGNVGLGTATPLKALHVQAGGTSLLTSAFGSGMIFSTNDASGSRLFLEHLGAGTNLKTSSIYSQNGISYFGAILNDAGNNWMFANPLTVNHSTGFVGINTTSPLSNLEVNGSFGANIISTGASAYTLISSDYTVVLTTAGAVVTLGSSVTKRIVNIKNGSTGNITITGHIDNVGSVTLTIPSGQSRTLHGNGTTWWLI